MVNNTKLKLKNEKQTSNQLNNNNNNNNNNNSGMNIRLRMWKIMRNANYSGTFSIQTDRKLDDNRPDIVLVDKLSKSCLIIDVACPNDWRVESKTRGEGQQIP